MACVMFLCTTALAADIVASGDCSDDPDDGKVTWTLYSDGKLEITGHGDTEDYKDYSPPWHRYKDQIKSVSVSGGVTSLGTYAFYGYENLKEVTINLDFSWDGRYIYEYAFANSGVETVNVLSSIDMIYPSAFSGCKNLKFINCSPHASHYNEFPDYYYRLSSLTGGFGSLCKGRQFVKFAPGASPYSPYKYNIPNEMTEIASYAFSDLQQLNEVGIPASVQEIGANAFSGDSLKDVIFFGAAPQNVAANAFVFDSDGAALPTIHCFCRYADSFRESPFYSTDDAGNETWCSLPLQADLHRWVVEDNDTVRCADCNTSPSLTLRNAFPDPELRSFITRWALNRSAADSDDNDALTPELLKKIADYADNKLIMDFSSETNSINSAEGLQLFLNQTSADLEIDLSNQYLQTLDLSGYSNLRYLSCSNNQLKRLDLDPTSYPYLENAVVSKQYIYDETPVLQGDRYNNYHFNIKDLLGEDVDPSRVTIISDDHKVTMDADGEVTYNGGFSANSVTGEVDYKRAPTTVRYKYDTGSVAYSEKVIMDVTWTPQQILPADDLIKKRGGCGNKLYYEFDSAGVLTITGSGDMWDYYDDSKRYGPIPWANLNIKKLVVGEGCTSICEKAFWNKNTIEEAVFLCDTLTIKKNAFTNCGDLKSADFSKCGSLTLGDYAFASCTQLSCITFNDGDTAVIKPGQYVFDYCRALSTVHLPKGVTMDGTYTSGLGMFTGCSSLRTATVDCAFIGPFTFECRALDRITFTDPNVQFYYFHTGEGQSDHPINVECQTELVGYDCSEVHKLANEQYKPNSVSLTFKQIEGDTGEHKNVVTVPAVEATCTKTGLTAGEQCSFCDTWTVPREEISKLPHTIVTDVGSAPTVGKAGKTGGSHCSVCNNVIVSQEDIPAWVTAVKYESGQLTVTVSGDAKGQLILAAYRENGQLSQLFLPTASSGGTYTLTVDAAETFKWKAFFANKTFAPAQYAYELPL